MTFYVYTERTGQTPSKGAVTKYANKGALEGHYLSNYRGDDFPQRDWDIEDYLGTDSPCRLVHAA